MTEGKGKIFDMNDKCVKAISSNKNNTLAEGQFFIHINRRENIHGLIQNIIYFKHKNKARINSKVVLQYYINPNKAGLFEGSFSGWVSLTPTLHISRSTNLISI